MSGLQVLSVGSTADYSTIEDMRDAWIKINTNFQLLFIGQFNVKDIGYGGAGLAFADSYPAIQAAITACQAAGGGTVMFPQDIYTVSQPPAVASNNIILRGFGNTVSVIKTASTSTGTLLYGSQSVSGSGKSTGGSIVDLGFQCPAASSANNVTIFGATRFKSERCDFFRGAIAVYMQNCDMPNMDDNNYRVTDTGAVAVRIVEGTTDDVTTGSFNNGTVDLQGTNSCGFVFGNGTGVANNPNEFNNLFIGRGMKINGNTVAGTTGIRLEAGCRNTLIQNVEFKNLRAYSIDAVTALLDAQKVYFTVDNCKMLGASGSAPTAHIYCKQSAVSGSATAINIRGAGMQMHTATNSILVDSGSPHVTVEQCDVVSTTNFLEITVGATPKFSLGKTQLSASSVTNNRGANLVAGTATYEAIGGAKFGNFAVYAEGTATIATSTTSIAVTAAFDYVPNSRDFNIVNTSSAGGDFGRIWVTNITVTGFTLNCTTAPSGAAATFQWKCRAG